jgi:hypothetical protein
MRHGKLKVIEVRGNNRAVIVRTTSEVVDEVRDRSEKITLGGKQVTTVLTSGVIGKLKKTATGSGMSRNGEVPER